MVVSLGKRGGTAASRLPNQNEGSVVELVPGVDVHAFEDGFLASFEVADAAGGAQLAEAVGLVEGTVLLELAVLDQLLFFAEAGFELVLPEYHAMLTEDALRRGAKDAVDAAIQGCMER